MIYIELAKLIAYTAILIHFLNCVGVAILKLLGSESLYQIKKSLAFAFVIIVLNYCYLILRIKINSIFIMLMVLYLIAFIYTKFEKRERRVGVKDRVGVLFIIASCVVYLFGEQFYVFRGNIWDWFDYVGAGIGFMNSNSSYDIDSEIDGFTVKISELLTNQRPTASLIIALMSAPKILDIFLISAILKLISIALVYEAYYYMCYKLWTRVNQTKPKIYLNLFTLCYISSPICLIIYETDALSHLICLPLMILFFAILFDRYGNNQKSEGVVIGGAVASAMFLVYPEGGIFYLLVGLIAIIIRMWKNPNRERKEVFILMSLTVLLVAPVYDSTVLYLWRQFLYATNNTNDWWGYFGAFYLGAVNPVLEVDRIADLRQSLQGQTIYSWIINLLLGNQNLILNILPSSVGLYFLTWHSDFIILGILLNVLSLLIAMNFTSNIRNVLISKNERGRVLAAAVLVFVTGLLLFIFKFKIWAALKIITFFSPILFLFQFSKINSDSKISLSRGFSLIIAIFLLFPIYKFSDYNDGIGRKDSFPSSIKDSQKKNFKYSLSAGQLTGCDFAVIDIDDQHFKKYVMLKLEYYGIPYLSINSYKNKIDSDPRFGDSLSIKKGCYIQMQETVAFVKDVK